MKAVTSSQVPEGSDGDHMKIYIWQGQWLAMNIDKRPLLRWQRAKIPTRLNLAIAARLAKALSPIKKAKSSLRHFQASPNFGLAALFCSGFLYGCLFRNGFFVADFFTVPFFGVFTQPAKFSVAICSITVMPAGLSFKQGI